jgi:hypothetical protein
MPINRTERQEYNEFQLPLKWAPYIMHIPYCMGVDVVSMWNDTPKATLFHINKETNIVTQI